jgi:hypothetical protein
MVGVVKRDFGLIVVCQFYKPALNELIYIQGLRKERNQDSHG